MLKEPKYIAITGLQHYFGASIFQLDQIVQLIKDPENAHDAEAIWVHLINVGKVGFIANSPTTVPKGYCSAGRLYDTFNHSVMGVVSA
jgi:hypothetical protein